MNDGDALMVKKKITGDSVQRLDCFFSFAFCCFWGFRQRTKRKIKLNQIKRGRTEAKKRSKKLEFVVGKEEEGKELSFSLFNPIKSLFSPKK